MTIVIIAAALFGAVVGKIASAKGRFGLLWSLYGVFLFPIALPHVILMKPIKRCPFCGRILKGKSECSRCKRELPVELTDSLVNSDLKDTFGMRMGDSIGKAMKTIARHGWEHTIEEEQDASRILCEAGEIYGYSADVIIENTAGKISSISVGYAADPDFKIYYGLRKAFVSKYGTPDYENFETNYSNHWTTKKFLVTLSTRRQEDEPSQYATVIVYMAFAKDVSEAVEKAAKTEQAPDEIL